MIADIQRELAQRGFYEGAVDGVYGPKMDAGIREFEQAAGLKATGEPSEALLRALARSPVKATPRPAASTQSVTRRGDPPAVAPVPSTRVAAVQRALADFGYGQIKPTGVFDAGTKSAIEKFERERKLPVTGQISERLARELGAVTGRPLE
jgi:peptidoglycan hydrolase-like protein with peptidoglycan-binding domain